MILLLLVKIIDNLVKQEKASLDRINKLDIEGKDSETIFLSIKERNESEVNKLRDEKRKLSIQIEENILHRLLRPKPR